MPILNGNDKAGEAKVYSTTLEMKQAVEIKELKDVLKDTLDFLEQAPFEFKNGNTHEGVDEGEVTGSACLSGLIVNIKKVVSCKN